MKTKLTKKKVNQYTKINLGCGWEKKEGFLNIDVASEVNPDIVHDLSEGLSFIQNNSIQYIYSSHCLEHIPPQGYSLLIDELFRVSKDGCIWNFLVPFDNIQTRTNNEHYRTYSWTSFQQYEGGKRFYYRRFKLKNLNKKVSFLEKIWFNLFPFLKAEIKLKYEVFKRD